MNVAAVLVAAGFEDTIRRMGAAFCNIHTRDPLQNVVVALKNAGVLVGAQFGTVQAQLQFRIDALHADWTKRKAEVGSSRRFALIGIGLQLNRIRKPESHQIQLLLKWAITNASPPAPIDSLGLYAARTLPAIEESRGRLFSGVAPWAQGLR
jgi:hypothetical protein